MATETIHKAKAKLGNAPLSTKAAIEICNYLRGRSTDDAKNVLRGVLRETHAIPYKRFTNGVGHRKGNLASGRYPKKAAKQFLTLIESAEANAENQGLAADLKITHLAANKAGKQYRYGRQRGRTAKRTHVTIEVTEQE